jgi:hypothetical protein
MAEPNESKKETVRIAPPTEPGSREASGENPRINLPARPPVNAPAPSAAPANAQTGETAAPRKETARLDSPSDPQSQRSSSVEMKKTQPLFTMPEPTEASVTPVTVTTGTEAGVEPIPTALCWAVLVISALLLIIQIWNYFS